MWWSSCDGVLTVCVRWADHHTRDARALSNMNHSHTCFLKRVWSMKIASIYKYDVFLAQQVFECFEGRFWCGFTPQLHSTGNVHMIEKLVLGGTRIGDLPILSPHALTSAPSSHAMAHSGCYTGWQLKSEIRDPVLESIFDLSLEFHGCGW